MLQGCVVQGSSGGAGKDITHLLEGLGKEHGLGKLFNRMQKLAWGESQHFCF